MRAATITGAAARKPRPVQGKRPSTVHVCPKSAFILNKSSHSKSGTYSLENALAKKPICQPFASQIQNDELYEVTFEIAVPAQASGYVVDAYASLAKDYEHLATAVNIEVTRTERRRNP